MSELLLIVVTQNMVLGSSPSSQMWTEGYVHSPIHSFLQWVQTHLSFTTLPRPCKLFRQWQNMQAQEGEEGKLRKLYEYSRDKSLRNWNSVRDLWTEWNKKSSVVRTDCREHCQNSTALYQKLYKHLPDCFSFSKDSCNSSHLISISQSIKDSINIYGRKGKEILSVEDEKQQKFCKCLGKQHVANALFHRQRITMEELGVV